MQSRNSRALLGEELLQLPVEVYGGVYYTLFRIGIKGQHIRPYSAISLVCALPVHYDLMRCALQAERVAMATWEERQKAPAEGARQQAVRHGHAARAQTSCFLPGSTALGRALRGEDRHLKLAT